MPNIAKASLIVLSLICAGGAARADATLSAHVTKTVAIGAPDRWDYLTFDAWSHRLYISHGDRLTVVDGRDGKILGTVGTFPGGTHGIAIVSSVGRGYTDDGRAGTADAFDLSSLKTVATIKAEADADGMLFDRPSGHVFVVDGDSGKLTAIDPAKNTAVATIDAGGPLEFAVSGDNGKVYVNGAKNKEIVRVDTATNKADAHWPIPNCESPHGLAIDTAGHRLFSSCENQILVVVNTDTGAEIAALPIGQGTDAAAFDPKRKLVFSSNFDGTLSVIQEKTPDSFVALPPVQTALGARTMALDPEGGRIYLVTADFTVNPNMPASDRRHKYAAKPGSAKLLFLDYGP